MNIQRYFEMYEGYFWEFGDDGEVVEDCNGKTIAYSQPILDLLEPLVVQGLPPFGAFLLVLAAMREDADMPLRRIRRDLRRFEENGEIKEFAEEVYAFLHMLRQLPENVQRGPLRPRLLQQLFHDCHGHVGPQTSKGLIANINIFYKSRRHKLESIVGNKKRLSENIVLRDFKCIALIKRQYPTAKDILDKLSGLPETDTFEPPQEETVAESGKDLIEILLENGTTFPVAALVRYLWSGLQIPVHQAVPSEQPLGGISDISNKGDFDKLLVSEFANDHLVFLSRIANGEALFLHREVPPHSSRFERDVLVDVSLKSWGTPKLIAYAIMIAVARHPKTDIPVSGFAVGSKYAPLQFNTREEVIASLHKLDTALDASEGLRAFLEEHKPSSSREIMFITSAEAYGTAPVQRVFSDFPGYFKYLVLLSNKGSMQLFRNSKKGMVLLQQLELPLDKLWAKKVPEVAPVEQKVKKPVAITVDLPVKYPILFPPISGRVKMFPCGDELFLIYKKQLFRRHNVPNIQPCYELVTNEKFKGHLMHAIGTAMHEYYFLSFNPLSKEANVLQISSLEQKQFYFGHWQKSYLYKQFFCYGGGFYYMMGLDDKWRIGLPGSEPEIDKVTRPERMNDFYQAFRKEMDAQPSSLGAGHTAFKRLTCAGITDAGKLMINNRQLNIKKDFLMLQLKTSDTLVFKGEMQSRNRSQFADGSTVFLHEAGTLVLISSNKDIPPIFIPAVLDAPLAAATQSYFSGQLHYKSAHEQQVILTVPGFYGHYINAFIQQIKQHVS